MLTLQQSSLTVPLGFIWIDPDFHFFHSWEGEWIYQSLTHSPITISPCDTYSCIMFYGCAFSLSRFLNSFHASVCMTSIFFQSFLSLLNSSRYRFFLTSSDDHLLLYYTRHYWKDVFLDSVSVHCLLWFWMSPAILHFSPDHIQVLKFSRLHNFALPPCPYLPFYIILSLFLVLCMSTVSIIMVFKSCQFLSQWWFLYDPHTWFGMTGLGINFQSMMPTNFHLPCHHSHFLYSLKLDWTLFRIGDWWTYLSI